MTQIFKCSTCRARKVKCDQTRPICNVCKRLGRTCIYPATDPSILLLEGTESDTAQTRSASETPSTANDDPTSATEALRLRTYRSAQGGAGLFQTLSKERGAKKNISKMSSASSMHAASSSRLPGPGPALALMSPQDRLISRWGAVMGNETSNPIPLHVYGNWIGVVPSRVGCDATLDLAVQYLVEAADYHSQKDRKSRDIAHTTGHKALKSLQSSVSNCSTEQNTMLAVKLHFFAEVFMSFGAYRHVLHVSGLSKILQSRVACQATDRLDCSMIEGSYYEDVFEVLLAGQDSMYDNVLFTEAMRKHLDQASVLEVATATLAEQFSKIPRLARLVRTAAQNPTNYVRLSEAVSLALDMYNNDPGRPISSALSATTLAKTVSPKVSSHLSESFRYASTEEFELANKYYSYRCLLCGLIQTLCTLGPEESSHFNLSAIEAQDLDAATSMAMMVDYAFLSDKPFPLNALRLNGPLDCSLGSWHRLEKRSQPFSAEAQHARRMQEWCFDITSGIMKQWGAKKDSLRLVQIKMETFAGGPTGEDVGRKIGWAAMVSEMREMSIQP